MRFTYFLHRFKLLRSLAKIVARRLTIKQRFYSGYIFLNAVEHSWAWTGGRNYMNFDAELQSFLHQKSKEYDLFMDIGSNLGVMTTGVLLSNAAIRAVAVDANKAALNLLSRTIRANKLSGRCEIIHAAVGPETRVTRFDTTGSVTGHIADIGTEIPMIKLSELINHYPGRRKLIKIDIEGYESALVPDFANINGIQGVTLVIELHELGFNGIGEPVKVFDALKALGGSFSDLGGQPLTQISPNMITQVVVNFS